MLLEGGCAEYAVGELSARYVGFTFPAETSGGKMDWTNNRTVETLSWYKYTVMHALPYPARRRLSCSPCHHIDSILPP